jgi:hypothetical protein
LDQRRILAARPDIRKKAFGTSAPQRGAIALAAIVLLPKFRRFRLACRRLEGGRAALDGSEDIVGGLGPFERFWAVIMGFDVTGDGDLQRASGSIDAAPDLPAGQVGEEALGLVDP